MQDVEKLRFPIGRFEMPEDISSKDREKWIRNLEEFPSKFRKQAKSLSLEQLRSLYRPDGWTGLQVIHHVADSHMNSLIRFKWTLTEDRPIIKAYNQKDWAGLPDGNSDKYQTSLDIISAVHDRWVFLLQNMSKSDWKRTFIHPETHYEWSLERLLSLYAWHGKHHLGHLNLL